MQQSKIESELLTKWLEFKPLQPLMIAVDVIEQQIKIINKGPCKVMVLSELSEKLPYDVSPSHAVIEPKSWTLFKFTTTVNVFSVNGEIAKDGFKLAAAILTEERMDELELQGNNGSIDGVKIEQLHEHIHLIKYDEAECNFTVAKETVASFLYKGALRLIDYFKIKPKYELLPSN